MAMTRYPIRFAYWMARCPRPPSPCTATVLLSLRPAWRRALKTVEPAQRRGAALVASISEGTRTAASARSVQYSATKRMISSPYSHIDGFMVREKRYQYSHPPFRFMPFAIGLSHICGQFCKH